MKVNKWRDEQDLTRIGFVVRYHQVFYHRRGARNAWVIFSQSMVSSKDLLDVPNSSQLLQDYQRLMSIRTSEMLDFPKGPERIVKDSRPGRDVWAIASDISEQLSDNSQFVDLCSTLTNTEVWLDQIAKSLGELSGGLESTSLKLSKAIEDLSDLSDAVEVSRDS